MKRILAVALLLLSLASVAFAEGGMPWPPGTAAKPPAAKIAI
ncbi:MAG: hypothetical protein WCA49_23115 [Candidatus Sulfotelmatobacter sp.]